MFRRHLWGCNLCDPWGILPPWWTDTGTTITKWFKKKPTNSWAAKCHMRAILSNECSSFYNADLLRCGVWLTAQQGSPTCPHPDRKTSVTTEGTSVSLMKCYRKISAIEDWIILFYHSWRDRLCPCHSLSFVLLLKFLQWTQTDTAGQSTVLLIFCDFLFA